MIGASIPEKYYDLVQNRSVAYRSRRVCKNCGFEWITAEIPMYHQWAGGSAQCCPEHTDTIGKVLMQITVDSARSGRYASGGLVRVMTMGGVYRRRQCKFEDCLDKHGKRSRWTTGEFASDGTIVADIFKCPRCNGNGRRHMVKK